MIITHCLTCKHHEEVEIDSELHSKCNKENCLSIYSNCIRVVAVDKFISQNNVNGREKASSALEICYPVA
jgi:hypothetical protein